MAENELMHYGIKGMKWGHRKANNHSHKSDKAYKKLVDYDTKISERKKAPTASNTIKRNKLYQKYDKQADKDIKKALKKGDTNAAAKISAGRTYSRLLIDGAFQTMAITDCAKRANVKLGEDFTYNIKRDDKLGGAVVRVNNHDELYVYDPSNNFVKK